MEQAPLSLSDSRTVTQRLDYFERRFDRMAARMDSLDRSTTIAETDIKHIAKTVDGLLGWVRWLVFLGVGTVGTAILNVVMKLPVIG